MLNDFNTQEKAAHVAEKDIGMHVKSSDPDNREQYKALQQAWEKKERTVDMTILLDPPTEHRIELGASSGQVSSTRSLMHRIDTLEIILTCRCITVSNYQHIRASYSCWP